MKNFIHHLEIKNFKSIKHLKTDCKRVNVFIGKPNVGKSNILEALGLLGATIDPNGTHLTKSIRYEEVSNLFYDDDLSEAVSILTDYVSASLVPNKSSLSSVFLLIGSQETNERSVAKYLENSNLRSTVTDDKLKSGQQIRRLVTPLQMNGKIVSEPIQVITLSQEPINPIKYYRFHLGGQISNRFPAYLLPPYGSNLFTIVDQDKELRQELVEIFDEYGLQFVAYKKEGKFEIEKNINGYIYKYPYSSMADTFQRLIFYFAIIDSNKDSILILEEPEVHSYPPYTKNLAERIVESEENQFFLTTHSPYILQELISSLDISELSVFITYFENYETKINQLTEEDLRRVSGFGIDLFFNLSQFTPNE